MDRSTLRNAFILGIVTFVIAPVMMLLGAINFFSVDRTRGARENWEANLGTAEQLIQHYSATTANGSALELERLSAALGITISPRSTDRSQADPDVQKTMRRLHQRIFYDYFEEQSTHVRRGELDPPPTELTEYLENHRDQLAALRRHLIESDTPVWESDFSKMYAAPIPNLLGHINAQKLLAAVALAQLHEGDRAGALETIHAAWSLSRSLRDSPALICQLIYLQTTRLQVATLRHVPDLPKVWEERLNEHDFRASFLTAMKLEGWAWLHAHPNEPLANNTTDPWGSGAASNWLKGSAVRLVRPYVSLCIADISDKWRKHVMLLEQEKTWCDRDLLEEGAAPPIEIPRWNHIGDLMLPNLQGATDRVARLELDQELLLLAIRTDAARRDAGGTLTPDTTLESTACPDDRWIHTRTPEGLEIALSREIQWPTRQQGPLLPLRLLLD